MPGALLPACAKPLSLFDRVNESLEKGDAVSLISLEFSKRFGAGQQKKNISYG